MQGAREFAPLFKTGQYGRLYIDSSEHARGKTFQIWVLPEGAEVVHCRIPSEAVEVYGVISGQPGWTETYGWLHRGKWCDDFAKMVQERKGAIERRKADEAAAKVAREQAEQAKKLSVLETYA